MSDLPPEQTVIHKLESRLKDAVREVRNCEEHTRQVMLELLRVRDEKEATQKCADAAAARAAVADQQQEELRVQLQKMEATCLEMEQTPGWWLIKSFHEQMKHSPMLARVIGVMVKAARSLRLLPAGCARDAQRIARLVDQEYYFRTYPEARAWGCTAAEHYLRLGASKGYNPSSTFDTQFYLAQYPDVRSGVNPLLHYLEVGASEGWRTKEEPLETPPDQELTVPDSPVALEVEISNVTTASGLIKLPDRFEIRSHRDLVSIVVTVHNALEYVRDCLSSIVSHTLPPYKLVLVDDGSEPETREYLQQFAVEHGAVLIRSEIATGYTLAANRGLRAASGEYVLLLNSDTIATENWLDRMVMCAESDPHIGIVGPLSNRANWQSIPEVIENGRWADNELPKNWTIQETARTVAAFTGRTYPRMPFLNGFCLLIKRQVLESVGYFDEVNFAHGYGEENDYSFRARSQGWTLAIADDAYVYHARTKSYSIDRRDELSEISQRMLYTKHKRSLIEKSVEQARDDLVLTGIRARAGQMFARKLLIEEGRRRWQGKRIAFLLPLAQACAVGDTVLVAASAMEEFGASVLIVNLLANVQAFRPMYPEVTLRIAFVPNPRDVANAVRECDAVIATTHDSVRLLQNLDRDAILAHYIHDFEPNFLTRGSAEYEAALSSYSLIPDVIRVTRTNSEGDELLRRVCVESAAVGPTCDIDVFRPRVTPSRDTLKVSAVIRPARPKAVTSAAMRVLAEIHRRYKDRASIDVFGADLRDPVFKDLPAGPRWKNYGVLTRAQRAAFLSGHDIFIDLFGDQTTELVAMEAMASGAMPVLAHIPSRIPFAIHEENALLVDPSNPTACCETIGSLIEDPRLLAKLRRRAQTDVVRFWPEQTAFNILSAVLPEAKSQPGVLPSSRGVLSRARLT